MAIGEAIDAKDFARTVTSLATVLANAPAGDLMRELLYMTHEAQAANFTMAQSGAGEQWPLRKYHGHPIKDKGRSGYPGHPLLIDTGDLYLSVTSTSGPDHVGEILDRAFTSGTDLPYAGFMEFGTDKIPARPFIGIGEEPVAAMADKVSEFGWSILMGV